MNIKEQVANVRALLVRLGFETAEPAAGDSAAATALQEYVTDAGVPVKIDQLQAGGMVYTEDGVTPVTVGFTLSDGTIVAVDDKGMITAVTAPVAAAAPVQPVAPVPPAIPAPTLPVGFEERFAALEKAVADLTAGNTQRFAEQKQYGEALSKVVGLVEQFAAEPSADPIQIPSGEPDVVSKSQRREAFAKNIAARKKV